MRKWTALIGNIVAFVLLPTIFLWPIISYRGPGSEFFWVILFAPSGLQFLPAALFVLIPFLFPLFNTLIPGKKLPRFAIILQSVFWTAWIGLASTGPLSQSNNENYIWYMLVVGALAVLTALAYIIYAVTNAIILRRKKGQKLSRSAVVTMSMIAVIIVGIFGTYISIDSYYQGRYNAARDDLQKIEAKSILPAGAKQWTNPNYEGQDRGNGISNLQYCATNSCPNVSRSWLVPIESGKEYEFIKSLANQNGFGSAVDQKKTTCNFDVAGVSSNECVAEGASGTLYMVLRLERIGDLKAMYVTSPGKEITLVDMSNLPNVSPKVWLSLNISLTRTWGN